MALIEQYSAVRAAIAIGWGVKLDGERMAVGQGRASEPRRRRIPGFRDYPDTTRLRAGTVRNTLFSW